MLALNYILLCILYAQLAPFPSTFHRQLLLATHINMSQVWVQAIQASPANQTVCMDKLKSALNYFIEDKTILNFIAYSGKGLNDLGMYKECSNSNGSVYALLNIESLLNLGLCVPSECNVDVLNNYKHQIAIIIKNLSPISITDDSINFYDVKYENEKYMKITPWRIIWLSVLGLIVVFCIVCTVCTNGMTESILNSRRYLRFLSCFNVSKNLHTILYSENKVDKNLDVINGVKGLSCGWVVTGHVFMFMAGAPITNLFEMIDYISKSFLFTTITGATVSVDVFFALAGFLSAMGITKLFYAPKQRNVKNILLLYLKRYIRLLPIYLCLFLLAYNVLPLPGSGPLYSRCYNIGRANCGDRWWMNLLFVNNIWHSKMCLSWTWYIANDMQFFIITPWLVWLYSIKKLAGFLATLALFLFSIGINIFLTIHYKIHIALTDLQNGFGDYFDKIYELPYARINTYLLGVFLAWLYLDFKDRKFASSVLTRINQALHNTYIRYATYIGGFALLNFSLYSYYPFNQDYTKVTMLMTVLYVSLSRAGFVIGLFCIIYPIMIGHGKPLLSVLGHQIFNALSKFTYAIYMLHLLVFSYYIYSTIQGIEFSWIFLMDKSGDIFVVGILLGLVGTVFFDSPMLNIEKHFLFRQEPPRNEKKQPNNQEMKPIINKTAE